MRIPSARKKPTNLSLDSDLVARAKTMGINVSEACERGLADEVKRSCEKKWLDDNRPALLAWNDWVRDNGMPYDEFRQY